MSFIFDVYSFYDQILSDYLKTNHSILIATGLTQNPFIEKEYYYRLNDHKNFIISVYGLLEMTIIFLIYNYLRVKLDAKL